MLFRNKFPVPQHYVTTITQQRGKNLPVRTPSSSSTLQVSTLQVLLCRHVSSCFVSLFRQQQVVQFDDDVGKVCEVHKVRGDDVDPVHPRPLGLDPGHDGWQVSGTKREEFVLDGETNILLLTFELKLIPWPRKGYVPSQVSVSVRFMVMAITLLKSAQMFLGWISSYQPNFMKRCW